MRSRWVVDRSNSFQWGDVASELVPEGVGAAGPRGAVTGRFPQIDAIRLAASIDFDLDTREAK